MASGPSRPSRPRPRSARSSRQGQASAGPQLSGVGWHGQLAYVSRQLRDGTTLRLLRLRYAGSDAWSFVIYRASHDDYEKLLLPGG